MAPPEHADDNDLLDNAIPIPKDELDELDADELEVVKPVEDLDELAPLEVKGLVDNDDAGAEAASSKIRQFAQRKAHEDHWNRVPNTTGQGAIHVKTFVAKLRIEAIEYLDEQVNEWLDAHPEYEVKQVTTTVGKLVGKNTEDAIFMSVWV
ncbi:hypothetical protein OT109_15070 [Phycisphaeraceae bacterium D3-23]